MKTNESELRAFYCRRLELPVNGCADLKTWQLKKMFSDKTRREENEYFEQK